MTHPRTRHYDVFKGLVLLGLMAILAVSWAVWGNNTPSATPLLAQDATATIAPTRPPASPTATRSALPDIIITTTAPDQQSIGVFNWIGLARPNTHIQIVASGHTIATVPVDNNGQWRYFGQVTAPGIYQIGAININNMGEVVGSTAPDYLKLSLTEPSVTKPTFNQIGATLPAGSLTLSGTGEPFTRIEVIANGITLDWVRTNSQGLWELDTTLTESGNYYVGLVGLDIQNQAVVASDFATMTLINTTNLTAPVISPLPATLAAGEIELSGFGAPESVLQIVIDGLVAETTTTDETGVWDTVVLLPDPGTYLLDVLKIDGYGFITGASETVTLTVVAPDESADTVEPTATLTATGVVTDVMAAEPTAAPDPTLEPTTTPTAEPVAEATPEAIPVRFIFPADLSQVLPGQLTLTGTGPPRITIEILDNGTKVGEAEVSSDGTWQFTYEPTEARHTMRVYPVTDPSNFTLLRYTVEPFSDNFDCDSNPGLDRGETYIIGSCDSMRNVVEVTGISFEDIMAANPSLDNPDILHPGQTLNLPSRAE